MMVGRINLISSSVRSEKVSCNTSRIVPSRKEKGKKLEIHLKDEFLRIFPLAEDRVCVPSRKEPAFFKTG